MRARVGDAPSTMRRAEREARQPVSAITPSEWRSSRSRSTEGCLASRLCPPSSRPRAGRPRPPRRPHPGLRPRASLLRGPEERHRRAGPRQRGDRPLRARARAARSSATGDVHYLRREDYHHHTALLCVQTKSTLADAEADVRHQRVLPEVQRGDGGVVRRLARGAATTLEIAERCDVELELGKQLIPRYPTPDGEPEERLPARAGRGGPARALRRPAARPRRVERARRRSSASSSGWASPPTS